MPIAPSFDGAARIKRMGAGCLMARAPSRAEPAGGIKVAATMRLAASQNDVRDGINHRVR
jgi:hypothetical protein